MSEQHFGGRNDFSSKESQGMNTSDSRTKNEDIMNNLDVRRDNVEVLKDLDYKCKTLKKLELELDEAKETRGSLLEANANIKMKVDYFKEELNKCKPNRSILKHGDVTHDALQVFALEDEILEFSTSSESSGCTEEEPAVSQYHTFKNTPDECAIPTPKPKPKPKSKLKRFKKASEAITKMFRCAEMGSPLCRACECKLDKNEQKQIVHSLHTPKFNPVRNVSVNTLDNGDVNLVVQTPMRRQQNQFGTLRRAHFLGSNSSKDAKIVKSKEKILVDNIDAIIESLHEIRSTLAK